MASSAPTQERLHAVEASTCTVTPLPAFGGERRTYRGIAQPFVSHAHSHYVLGMVRSGRRDLDLEGETVAIGPGDILAFNPGQAHGCSQSEAGAFAYDSVTVDADILDGAVLASILESGHPDRAGRSDRLKRRAQATRAFQTLLRSVDQGDSDDVQLNLLHELSRLLEDPAARSQRSSHEGSVLRVHAHLHGHLSEPKSIAKLAEQERLSESSLIRAYKRRYALTPMQHLASMRVDCACRLLAEGASAADVAAELGFADQSHLSRAFKQRIGTTPGVYRRSHAKPSLAANNCGRELEEAQAKTEGCA